MSSRSLIFDLFRAPETQLELQTLKGTFSDPWEEAKYRLWMASKLVVTTGAEADVSGGLAYGSIDDVEAGSPRHRRGAVVEEWRRWITASPRC